MPASTGTPPVLDRTMQSLIRIQILSPLSFLVSLGTLGIGSFVLRPSLSDVGEQHFTYISPRDSLLLIYWAVVYLAQIAFALFITLASGSQHVKNVITYGVGLRLAFANFALAVWVPLWVINTKGTFIAATVMLALGALGLLYSVFYMHLKTDYRPSFRHKPFEWICVNLPVKLFLVVLLHVDTWQQLLMALNLDLGEGKQALRSSVWPVFAIITSVAALTSFWIFATTDVVWFAASVYLYTSILFSTVPSGNKGGQGDDPLGGGDGKSPIDKVAAHRPPEVLAALLLAIALQTTAFIASVAWSRLMARREGRVALPITAEEEAAAEEARRRRVSAAADRKKKGISRRGYPTEQEEAAAAETEALLQHDEAAEEQSKAAGETNPSQIEQGEASAHNVQVTRKLGGAE